MRTKTPKNAKKYECKKCDYVSSNKYDYKRHLKTIKHNTYKILTHTSSKHVICHCGKQYLHRQSLYNHKKKCKLVKNIDNSLQSSNEIVTSVVTENKIIVQDSDVKTQLATLLQQNEEMKHLVVKACENGLGNTTNNNNNNTNNNNITINMYLDDICKDAMFFDDFVNGIGVSVPDLLLTHKTGFVNGISTLFLNNLKNMPAIQRPIHCSDQKRNKFYIKIKNEGWTNKIHADASVDTAIEYIANQYMETLKQWEGENPTYMTDDKTNIKWHQMIKIMLDGISDEHSEKNTNGIKKKLGNLLCLKGAIKDALEAKSHECKLLKNIKNQL